MNRFEDNPKLREAKQIIVHKNGCLFGRNYIFKLQPTAICHQLMVKFKQFTLLIIINRT